MSQILYKDSVVVVFMSKVWNTPKSIKRQEPQRNIELWRAKSWTSLCGLGFGLVYLKYCNAMVEENLYEIAWNV